MSQMGLLTTDTVPGHEASITVVFSPLVVQVNAPSAQEAWDEATSQLRQQASRHGANCVVGVGFSSSILVGKNVFGGDTEHVIMAYGTAVRVDPPFNTH